MLLEAYEVWKAYTELPILWTGWDHASTPVAFHTDEEAVMFAHPAPPSGFSGITIGGRVAHICRPKPKQFTANTSLEVNGVQTATIMWADRSRPAMVALTAHEAFHAHQVSHGFPYGNIMLMSAYPVYDCMVNALGEVEAKLLHRALSADDTEAAKQALDARAARQELLTSELCAFENGTEYQEGLAVYIEVRAQGKGDPNWQRWLSFLANANRNGEGAARYRFYASGMAYGLLLDRYMPKWQTVVMKNWPALAHVLADVMQHKPNPDRREFTDLSFQDILALQERDVLTREREVRRQVSDALPGIGLRVEASFCGTPVGGAWHPYQVQVLPGQSRFHPTLFSYIYDDGGEFRVERGGVEPEIVRRVIFERTDLQITMDGRPFSGESALGLLEIKGHDCYLRMPHAAVRLVDNLLEATQQSQD